MGRGKIRLSSLRYVKAYVILSHSDKKKAFREVDSIDSLTHMFKQSDLEPHSLEIEDQTERSLDNVGQKTQLLSIMLQVETKGPCCATFRARDPTCAS